MATTDLETLEARVQALVKDSGAADWTTSELDQAIRLALSELSQLCPARYEATLDVVDGQYEYDLDSLALLPELQAVVEVWYPYLSTDDTYRLAHPVKWRMLSVHVLLIEPDEEPDASYKLRLFYDKVQQLEGLDSAVSTTLNDAEKSCLVLGAAGYAAVAKAQYLANRVTTGEDAAQMVGKWGNARIAEFKQRAFQLAQHDSMGDDARIGWWPADEWDV